jgi:hypothetical protein
MDANDQQRGRQRSALQGRGSRRRSPTLYVCIRFQDKTDFALEFSPQIVKVGTELCDSATDDFDVIRNYYQEQSE